MQREGEVFIEYLAALAAIGLAYLIGSVSFGFLAAKKLKGVDLRELGSGGTGATNTMRILGAGPAALVLVLDGLKGVAAVYLARYLGGGSAAVVILASLAAIAGHNWPVFFGFRGGRGIATSLGVLLAISPGIFFWVFITGIAVIAVTRYVSLGSITGALLLPFLMAYYGLEIPYIIFGTAMSGLAIYRHKPNLQRLREGKENRLGGKSYGSPGKKKPRAPRR